MVDTVICIAPIITVTVGKSSFIQGRITTAHGRVNRVHQGLHQCTPQSASTPYRCCPLLSRFEYIYCWICPGPCSPSKLPLHTWGSGRPSNTRFPGSTRVLIPNGITICAAVFAQLTVVTERPTDHATPFVAICHI